MSAISSYNKYGITRTQLHSLLINRFNFPSQYQDCLSSYFSYVVSPNKFFDMMVSGSITLREDQKCAYLVVYKECTPTSLKSVQQLKLSFRKPAPEFGLDAYVLVRIQPLDTISTHKCENSNE